MYLSKGYQTSEPLQAIYNAKIATSKLFLSIFKRCPKDKWGWLPRKPLANDAGVSERHQTRLAKELVELGVIEKQAHGTNRSHYSAYRITELGYQVKHIFEQIYSSNKYIIFSVSLLLSPAKTHVPLLSSKVFIKEVSSLSSYSKLQTAPTRETQNNQNLPMTASKEVTVSRMEHKIMDLPEHVVSLTPLLQLTTHGQLKLCIFDKETVDYAWASVKQANSCKDVFKELVELCLKSYEANDRRPDWAYYYDMMKTGIADKKDKYTAKTITSAMIKPKVAKQDVNPFAESASFTAYKNRDKSLDPVRWIDRQVIENPARFEANKREFLAIIEGHVGQQAPADVLDRLGIKDEVVVVPSRPTEWSPNDKQLVEWALDYIGKMTKGRQFYEPFVQEILLGPDSPRARTRELQDGLRLMQRLYYVEIANQVIATPEEQVVTELKDQIVCAQIERDEVVWENMKYSPVDDDSIFEEVMD